MYSYHFEWATNFYYSHVHLMWSSYEFHNFLLCFIIASIVKRVLVYFISMFSFFFSSSGMFLKRNEIIFDKHFMIQAKYCQTIYARTVWFESGKHLNSMFIKFFNIKPLSHNRQHHIAHRVYWKWGSKIKRSKIQSVLSPVNKKWKIEN